MERTYPNQFSRIGVSDAEARERAERCFDTLFFDPGEKIYQDVDADSGCMVDTGNIDARTEGMSYGMMMCVQMKRLLHKVLAQLMRVGALLSVSAGPRCSVSCRDFKGGIVRDRYRKAILHR